MSLNEILEHRRAIRHFDENKPLDTERVKECLRMATLAPTSSNMQLWECYHVTDQAVKDKLTIALLGQKTARTAQEIVVFVTRQDKYKEHAKANLDFELGNIKRNSPAKTHERRSKVVYQYYGKLMPFVYSRCFGGIGAFRKLLAQVIGMFRPIIRQVSEQDMRVVTHKSCALAVQTFMLGMAEAGYDTCPLEGFDSKLVKKALSLPYNCEINMIITCGIRVPDGVHGDRFRLPFDEVYHRI